MYSYNRATALQSYYRRASQEIIETGRFRPKCWKDLAIEVGPNTCFLYTYFCLDGGPQTNQLARFQESSLGFKGSEPC